MLWMSYLTDSSLQTLLSWDAWVNQYLHPFLNAHLPPPKDQKVYNLKDVIVTANQANHWTNGPLFFTVPGEGKWSEMGAIIYLLK